MNWLRLSVCAAAMVCSVFAFPAGAVEYKHPGAYVEESRSQAKPIEGVNTNTTPFTISDSRTAQVKPTGPIVVIGPGMQRDTNYFGSDYKHLDNISAAQCQTACKNESQCKAWTWQRPDPKTKRLALCWLKNHIPAPSLDVCCVSGAKAEAAGSAVLPLKATEPARPKAAGTPAGTQQPSRGATGVPPLASGKARVASRARLSAPIRIKNMQAQQSQQRLMDNVQQQNALAASTYRALLTEQGAEGLVQLGILKPEVLTINKQRPAGFVFRPGTAVAIHGRGLGSGGQLRLLGSFRSTPRFSVNDWRPSVIYARLADDISGEEDLDDIRFEIQPAGKQSIVVPGVRFEATRETTLLKDVSQRYVSLPGQWVYYGVGGQTACLDWWDLRDMFGNSAAPQSALVYRCNIGRHIDWIPAGTDIYNLPLRPGFEIENTVFSHLAVVTSASECQASAGGTYFRGRYGVTIESPNTIKVDWGVERCHVSPDVFDHVSTDMHRSAYGLDVYVIGPRGLSPWK
jgi:PAN domain